MLILQCSFCNCYISHTVVSAAAAAAAVTHPWECSYHAALCLEKVLTALPTACDAAFAAAAAAAPTAAAPAATAAAAALDGLYACLLYPHAWVRLACARTWGVYLSRRDPATLLPLATHAAATPSNSTASKAA